MDEKEQHDRLMASLRLAMWAVRLMMFLMIAWVIVTIANAVSRTSCECKPCPTAERTP